MTTPCQYCGMEHRTPGPHACEPPIQIPDLPVVAYSNGGTIGGPSFWTWEYYPNQEERRKKGLRIVINKTEGRPGMVKLVKGNSNPWPAGCAAYKEIAFVRVRTIPSPQLDRAVEHMLKTFFQTRA